MYRDSIYCVVVPGDSLITPRIFSYVQAGCVPLFPFAADYLRYILPLPHSIAWEDLASLSTCASSPTGAATAAQPTATLSAPS